MNPEGFLLKKHHRTTMMTMALQQIRDAIVAGKFKPGYHLVETELADQMNISRLPIREAIRHLQQEGLVVIIPYKGAFVSSVDSVDLAEIYTVRSSLEELAVRLLAPRITPTQKQVLLSVLDELTGALEKNLLEKAIDADLEFHRTLCRFSDNRRLLDFWQTLLRQLRPFINLEKRLYQNAMDQIDEHMAIYKAVSSGDPDAAVQSIRIHMETAIQTLSATAARP